MPDAQNTARTPTPCRYGLWVHVKFYLRLLGDVRLRSPLHDMAFVRSTMRGHRERRHA